MSLVNIDFYRKLKSFLGPIDVWMLVATVILILMAHLLLWLPLPFGLMLLALVVGSVLGTVQSDDLSDYAIVLGLL
jgi:tetrahydromethanopterin S-methyltransferase subunit E